MNSLATRRHRLPPAMSTVAMHPAVIGAVRNDAGGDDELLNVMAKVRKELERIGGQHSEKIERLETQVLDLAQQIAGRRGFGGGGEIEPSPGARVAQSDGFKAFGGANGKGTFRTVVNTITSGETSAGPMIAPDRRGELVGLPRRRLTVRALLAPGQTGSNLVEYGKQTTRTNNARPVTEGTEKPESNYAWELDDAPVRTIAHWVHVSRQAMDDAAQLQSAIDSELRYGLALKEEQQFLKGDGTGQNLYGIIPQASAYDTNRNEAGDTWFDTLAHAIAQAQVALLPATGIVMNDDDLEALKVIKDQEKRYIGGGPFGPPITMIWGRPVVGTPEMESGKFLVGAFFDGAQIFDRMDAEVVISSEDRDNFIKNMLTVRGEERLALAVKRPDAFIYGEFPVTTG